jgi:hypothetical protein
MSSMLRKKICPETSDSERYSTDGEDEDEEVKDIYAG